MTDITIRTFAPEDAAGIAALQKRCLETCVDGDPIDPGFYFAPAFENGRNVLCAFDGNDLAGYAYLYPHYASARLRGWLILAMDVKADPARADAISTKGQLYERAIERAGQIKQVRGDANAMLSATYFAEGEASLSYVESKGLRPYESVLLMARDLPAPLPVRERPNGVEVRRWRMESWDEQCRYIEAYDAAFRDTDGPWNIEELRHFMGSGMWAAGTTFTAFAGEDIAGSVMVYFDPDFSRNPGKVGFTERVFVMPQWRKRGVAGHLLARGLGFLRAKGLGVAVMQVFADNQPAIRLYESLGYRVARTEISAGMEI